MVRTVVSRRRHDRSTATDDGTPAPEAIASLAREAQLQQLSSLDGLDSKAASLIGFAGIVLGLLFTAPSLTGHWNWAMTAGAAFLITGVVPLAWAVLPRAYSYNPNISALAQYADESSRDIHEVIYKSISRALASNVPILKAKGVAIRAGIAFLVVGLAFATGGVLYSVNTRGSGAPSASASQPPKGLEPR